MDQEQKVKYLDAREDDIQPGDRLREELKKIEVAEPTHLNELLYTAQESGMDVGDVQEALLAYKIILLAQSYGSRPIEYLRM